MGEARVRIWCPTCEGEHAAAKRRGPPPGKPTQPARWWNVCLVCSTHFAALAPDARERRRLRAARRAGQMALFAEAA
jgi:hypothetical protein